MLGVCHRRSNTQSDNQKAERSGAGESGEVAEEEGGDREGDREGCGCRQGDSKQTTGGNLPGSCSASFRQLRPSEGTHSSLATKHLTFCPH